MGSLATGYGAHQCEVSMNRTARQTLDLLAELRRGGCRVLSARLLPSAAVRVDRAPAGLASAVTISTPLSGCRCQAQHVVQVGGIRITWPVPITPR